jgi:hypothetical protein
VRREGRGEKRRVRKRRRNRWTAFSLPLLFPLFLYIYIYLKISAYLLLYSGESGQYYSDLLTSRKHRWVDIVFHLNENTYHRQSALWHVKEL